MKLRTILILVGLLVLSCAGLIGLSIYLAVAPDPETLTGAYYGSLQSVAFSPDGTTVVAGGQSGEIRVWGVATRQESPRVLFGHQQVVTGLSFRPDGKLLASAAGDGVILWDMLSGVEAARVPFASAPNIKALAFSRDGQTLALGGDSLVFWDPTNRREKLAVRKSGAVHTLRYSPDGKQVATGGRRGIVLWDAETGQEIATVYTPADNVIPVDLAFSPDGKTIAWAGNDSDVYLWDVEGRKEIAKLSGHTDRVAAVAFHPEGKWLASGDAAEQVFVWDVVTQTQITFRQQSYRSLGGNPGGPVAALAFSSDGKLLASAGGPIVKLWEVAKLAR